MTPTPSLDQLAADPALAAALPPGALAELYRRAVRFEATLRAEVLLRQANGRPEAPAEDLQHLSVPQVATLLKLPKARVYELIRQGEIPAIRIGEKNVRVPLTALREWLARCQKRGLDTPINGTLISPRDRFRASRTPGAARPDPARIRQAGRRALRDGQPLGARPHADQRAHGPLHPAPGEGGADENG